MFPERPHTPGKRVHFAASRRLPYGRPAPLLRLDSERRGEKQEGHYDGQPSGQAHDHPFRAGIITAHAACLPNAAVHLRRSE